MNFREISRIAKTKQIFRADPLMSFAVMMLLVLILTSLIGPMLPIGDPIAIGAGPRLAPPNAEFLIGTDELGRAYLPRIVDGILVTILLSAVAVLLTSFLGVMIGLTAAYYGGKIDLIATRFADVLYAFPAIILGILITSVIGPGNTSVITVIVVATLPLFIRVVRSVALSIASREFVTGAEVAGASPLRIMVFHMLPNISGAVVVHLTYALSIGMLIESGMSFLGLGTQPPYPSLGSLLQQGTTYLTIAPWLVFAPGLVLALAILSVNLLGDGIRDMIDPLKGKSVQ